MGRDINAAVKVFFGDRAVGCRTQHLQLGIMAPPRDAPEPRLHGGLYTKNAKLTLAALPHCRGSGAPDNIHRLLFGTNTMRCGFCLVTRPLPPQVTCKAGSDHQSGSGAGTDSAFVPPTKIPGLCQQQVLVLDGGAHHSAAVTANGNCLVWGRIDDGHLGVDFTPEQLQDATLIRHDERNKPRICLRPSIIPTVQQATYVACSSDHTFLIDRAGSAYSSGYGFHGPAWP